MIPLSFSLAPSMSGNVRLVLVVRFLVFRLFLASPLSLAPAVASVPPLTFNVGLAHCLCPLPLMDLFHVDLFAAYA